MSPPFCYYLSQLIIVLIACRGTTLSCGINEYEWTVNGVKGCCPMCPAGKYLEKRCASFREPAKCEVCPDGYFIDHPNTYSSCAPCSTCFEDGTEYKKKCDPASDVECMCRPGYSSGKDNSFNGKCIKLCDKGQQLNSEDSKTCESCQSGYYSDEKGSTCKRWTDCEATGQYLIKNGSKIADAQCGLSIPTVKTTAAEGRTIPTLVTVSVINTAARTTSSVTTAGKPALAGESKFLIAVVVVAAVIFVIVLIKRRIIRFRVKNRDFHQCFGIREDTKPPVPVQEEFKDVTSVQVKN